MNLILFGPPGSGKGTQAQLLEDLLHYYHISTGEILREATQNNTELGLKARRFMDKGLLVPDHLIGAMVRDKLSALLPVQMRFLFDGYPRNLEQVKQLEAILEELGLGGYLVLSLEVSQEEVMKRLLGRLICPKCGKNYNEYSHKPQRPNMCDICSGELVRRSDDSEKTIRERLRVYKEQTKPLLEYFSQNGTLRRISGEGGVNHILDSIVKTLEGKA